MKFNFFSIRLKLILLLSLTAAIALLISSLIFSYYIYSSEKESYVKSLTQLSMISSENIKPAIVFLDDTSANNIIAPFKLNENILSTTVYDESILPFATYNSKDLNGHQIEEIKDESIKIIKEFEDRIIQNREIINIVKWNKIFVLVPIILEEEDKVVGIFQIISNTQEIKEKLINLTIIQIVIIILTLILITYLSTKVQQIFTSPIFKLVDVMNYISKSKKYDVEIDLNRLDEFKNLNDGFNSMIKEINNRDHNLSNLIEKLEIAKKEIEEIHTQLKDSINYASLIQQTLMPKNESFEKYFKDFFVLWQPRDVVGGDIYLFEELPKDKGCLLMVIDCTGHGVGGAFVTMLTKAIEREIVSNIIADDRDISPSEILSIFNKTIKQLLKQDSKDAPSNAGFDGGIVYFNKREKFIKYAGANTPLFILQNDKIEIIKGSKHSIGYKTSNVDYVFEEYSIDVSSETYLYLTTDGYLDQTSEENNFMFGKKRFQKLIKDNHEKTFEIQKRIFEDTLTTYRGKNSKLDDVTVVGVKI